MPRSVNPVPQYFSDSGDPLAFGKMFYFESGSNTLKDLFSDGDFSIVAQNPVILTGAGRLPNTFYKGSVRQKLTDKDDVQYWDVDPVVSGGSSGAFEDWNSVQTYNIPDIVVGSNDKFYQTIIDNNQDSDPTLTPAEWKEIQFLDIWNVNVSYLVNDTVKASDGNLYRAVNAQSGNDPIAETGDWTAAVNITGSTLARTYASALSF